MKAVIQKCLSASVSVDGKVVSKIGEGLLCLIGIGKDDKETDAETLATTILNKRVWQDESGNHWQRSVVDMSLSLLCVSQFTLMAQTRTGTKPSFHNAMTAEDSRRLYIYFLQKMKDLYQEDRIYDGQFQAMMEVSLVNNGPVTLILDTQENRQGGKSAGEVDPKKAALAEAKEARRREIEERTKANEERKRQTAEQFRHSPDGRE